MRRVNRLNLKANAKPSERPAAKRAARAPREVPPAPDGPFIDGRTTFDWARVPGFAPASSHAADRPALDVVGPRPLSPLAGDVVDAAALALAWEGVAGATGYQVEVSPDPTFAADVLALKVGPATELALVGALPAVGARLFWRVRALLAGDAGQWSARARFYAGRPQDLVAAQARESAQSDEARRQAAQRRREEETRLALVPLYLREDAVTNGLDTGVMLLLLVGTLLTVLLVGVLGTLLA